MDQSWKVSARLTALNNVNVWVNDSLIIDQSIGVFSSRADFSGEYRSSKVNVFMTYNSGILGIGAGWETIVSIDGEIAGRFKL